MQEYSRLYPTAKASGFYRANYNVGEYVKQANNHKDILLLARCVGISFMLDCNKIPMKRM